MPERLYISVFDPPNGDNFMLVSNTITMPGKSTFTFDLKADDYSKSEMIALQFYGSDDNRYFVFFNTAENVPE